MRKYCEAHDRTYFQEWCPECAEETHERAKEAAAMVTNAQAERIKELEGKLEDRERAYSDLSQYCAMKLRELETLTSKLDAETTRCQTGWQLANEMKADRDGLAAVLQRSQKAGLECVEMLGTYSREVADLQSRLKASVNAHNEIFDALKSSVAAETAAMNAVRSLESSLEDARKMIRTMTDRALERESRLDSALKLLDSQICADCMGSGVVETQVERSVAECCRRPNNDGSCCGNAVAALELDVESGPCQWCAEIAAIKAGVVEKPVRFEDCPLCRSNDVIRYDPPLYPKSVFHCRACSAEWAPSE